MANTRGIGTVDLDFAGKSKGKGKGMQFGGKGSMSPMQMVMAAINAMKGGGKGFNNNSSNNNTKGGFEGGNGGKDSGKGCFNCVGNRQRLLPTQEGDEGMVQVWQNRPFGQGLQSCNQRG